MSEYVEEQPVGPGAKTVAMVVCAVLLLGALCVGGLVRWMRPPPPISTYRPMHVSDDSDSDAMPVVTPGGKSTPQQVGRVGTDHPYPMFDPSPNVPMPTGVGVIGGGGHLYKPSSH